MEFSYQMVSALCKVFPNGKNRKELASQTLTGLRGETLSFQIAYRWDKWGRSFGTVETDSPLPVRVRTVELSPCQYPCHITRDEGYLATEPGLYPDLLREPGPRGFPLISGQWRSLWVDVELGEDVPAGEYPVSITLKIQGENAGQCRINCKVLDLALSKLPVPHTEWFHSDCLANYYGVEVFSEKYWEIVEAFVRTAAKRHCNMLLTPVFTPPLDTAVGGERRTVQLVDVELWEGKYSFGFEKFRRWVKMALDCGMEYIEIAHLFSQWGAKAAPKIMGMADGAEKQLFGWDTDAGGQEYGDFLRQFLQALKEELRALGIGERTFFHISDEPGMEQLGTYRKAWEAVAGELSGYNIIDALSDHAFYKEGLVQQPVCALDHIGPFLEDRPQKLWGYYCTAQCINVPNRFIVQPGCRTRILGLLMYRFRLDGFLHWGYNFYNSQYSLCPIDPYQTTDAGGAFPAGDPFLVYPGADGRPEESMRLMHMDEAMADLCAFTALEQLAGREAALACIEGEPAFDQYPQDEDYLLGVRETVNRRIEEALKQR